MREKQLQVLSSFAAKMTNSKYGNQKKRLEDELKIFRARYNYDKMMDYLLEQEK